jgi:hypothetical protein
MVRQRQQFTDFMDWLQEKLWNRQTVMETPYTLEELETALQQRREVIKKLEQQAEQCYEKEQNYLDRQDSATGIRKQTATLDAKSAQRERLRYEKIHRNLSLQQLFLRNLVEHVREKRFAEQPLDELGLDGVDVQAMNQQAVIDAINESATDLNDPMPQGLQEMQWALDNANENTVTPDLDQLKDGYWATDEELDGEYTPNEDLDQMLDDMVTDVTDSQDTDQEPDVVEG